MKKAIVFGATGQLGCYSALALKEDGYDVVAVGRRKSDGGFFATKGIQFVGGVTLENADSFSLIPNQYYDAVVNMAGTMPAHADTNPMPYVQSICVGIVNLTNWMKQNGSKRIILILRRAMCMIYGISLSRLTMMPTDLFRKTAAIMRFMPYASGPLQIFWSTSKSPMI